MKAGKLTLSKAKIVSANINVVLVSDAKIKILNKNFRKVNRITDIISFKLSSSPLEGDIYIAEQRSKKQAVQFNHDWKKELSYLVIHGILHLLDYKDYTPKDRLKMFAKQDKIFADLHTGNGTLETHI
ncbi:MAG: rRNA maturation RNase YbeY [Elusimicrobia bacterium]|nr:rRNA maturation RNase YbeY [Elusimicrobiota bacterium]